MGPCISSSFLLMDLGLKKCLASPMAYAKAWRSTNPKGSRSRHNPRRIFYFSHFQDIEDYIEAAKSSLRTIKARWIPIFYICLTAAEVQRSAPTSRPRAAPWARTCRMRPLMMKRNYNSWPPDFGDAWAMPAIKNVDVPYAMVDVNLSCWGCMAHAVHKKLCL